MKLFFKSQPVPAGESDSELLAQYAKTGDSEIFGRLYTAYIPLLYGLCLKYLKDEQGAQDAVMDIFEYLLPRISHYSIGNFRTWLHSVARNHCLQCLKQQGLEISIDSLPQIVEKQSEFSLFDTDMDEIKTQLLKKCMQKLPPPQQQSVELFYYQSLSYADIVEQQGWALKSVKSYIQNGKRNLKICMEQQLKKLESI